MEEIRNDTVKIVKEKKEEKKLVTEKRIKTFISVLVIVICLIQPTKKLYKSFLQIVELNDNLANKAIEARGEMLINEINMYKEFGGNYPTRIDNISYGLIDLVSQDFEKENLGRVTGPSDIKYKSDGKDYELCISVKKYSRCWQNGITK